MMDEIDIVESVAKFIFSVNKIILLRQIKQEIAAQLLSILPKYRKLDGTEYYLYMSPYFEFKISFKLKTKNSVKNNLFEHIIIV